jgi:glycosyltransferase involved in cell wall biosynthesis
VTPVPVLHVCDKFGVKGSSIHGVSRLFSWWFPRFDRRFDVSLCGLKAAEPASQLLESQGISVTHLGRRKLDPRILTDLVALGRKRGARILHVHGYAASDFGRLAARQLGAALILHEHFADPRMPAYQAVADRLLSRLTDRAIAVSQSTADFLVNERFVPRERVHLIWNGAPLDTFAPAPPEQAHAVREALGIPAGATLIGAIARLNEQKGHRYLLDAAALMMRARTDVRVLIAGDGDLMGPLKEQARALGLSDRVTFAGHRTDVPDLLGAIDVFCISSIYEGTPLTLFEAMAAGKTIVSTAVDGCAEVLKHGETGLLVPPRDPEALAAALARVVDDHPLARSLADAARRDSARYDAAECVRRMETLYDEVLAEKAR